MDCNSPLSDDQISAFLDGEADTFVMEHVAQCEHCATRIAEARRVEQRLKRDLYRWDCPDPMEIGEFYLDRLSLADKQRLEQHLAQCTHCRAELAELRAFLQADPTIGTPQELTPQLPSRRSRMPRLNEFIGRLVPTAPALALRGMEEGPLVLEADGIMIFLETQHEGDETILQGQLAADDIAPWAGGLVQLRQAGQLQTTAVVDDMGFFRCGSFTNKPFELRITSEGGQTIRVFDLEFPG